jgi:UDP-2,4-diacetamido-2,4,6-trideoxy-beta-L-altropyranose hydrolase
MRCLTLADELKREGARIKFVTRNHVGHLASLIQDRGYEAILLPEPNGTQQSLGVDPIHAHWLSVPWEQDAKEMREVMSCQSADWLIIDHYGIDRRWHQALRSSAKRNMVIDDMIDRDWDCELLLDQTYGRQAELYAQSVPTHCKLLLGSQYALLRPEFAELRPHAIEKRKHCTDIHKILVSIGGVDPGNLTLQVLDGLARMKWRELPSIDVVFGEHAPHYQDIKRYAQAYPLQINVMRNVSNMAVLMLEADLSIGSGGATSWERCCLGLPSIAICLARNQEEITQAVERAGASTTLDFAEDSESLKVENALRPFEEEPRLLQKMSEQGFKMVDGLGSRRVVKIMECVN